MYKDRQLAKAAAVKGAAQTLTVAKSGRLLAAWRTLTPTLAAARMAREAADAHWGARRKAVVLRVWRQRAAELAAKHARQWCAAAFREASLVQRGWQAWRRWTWCVGILCTERLLLFENGWVAMLHNTNSNHTRVV